MMFNNIQYEKGTGEKSAGIKRFRFSIKLIINILLFVILILSPIISFSQSSGGGYAESFLFRNIGARPISMAGAYTAIANQPDAIFYNPAGLSFFNPNPMVISTVSSLGLGRSTQTLAWGQTIYDNLGVGLGINSFYGGQFTARDIKGNSLGNMQDWEYNITASAAYRIEFASIGASVKMLKNNLIGSSNYADGYSFDIGTKFNVLDLFSAGIVVQNVTGLMFWNTKNTNLEAVPFTVRAGIGAEFGLNDEIVKSRSTVNGEEMEVYVPPTRYILTGLDVVYTQYQTSPTVVLGVEAVVHEIVAFRGGIALYGDSFGIPQLFPMTYWGAGMSFRPDLESLDIIVPFKINFDYTISNEYVSQSGVSHHLSVLFEF